MSNQVSKFKVGDKVFHVGHGLGEVIAVDSGVAEPIWVLFGEPDTVCRVKERFTLDGRYQTSHSVPSLLTLGEARAKGYDVPKQRVKKKITRWVNVYRYYESDAFSTKEAADHLATPDRITCVELTGEYFVEE